MKRVRMLLRVSSNQQLESDGDLSVQRQLVKEYIEKQKDWKLDKKEYFEGSNSGYKNAVADRDVLQEALNDAQNKEYDILVAYKDDRIGRRMWEIGAYVMALKNSGVDIYTVKDGCISPESDDIMGQIILALRYGNAQKSSSDTGMRVKDTAQKLVQQGKFMGGAAPYGYELVLSGEISKHGRALHKLQIIPEKAEIVKRIYSLSLNKEYGSAKIAKLLNEDICLKSLAPNDIWKSGTITSILTNPIYAGYTAYKRRECRNGKYHRLDSKDWIKANVPNLEIQIIEEDVWNKTQEKRKRRADNYVKTLANKDVTVIRKNTGTLSLIDVIYCGYCGRKLTNGTKYSYWTIKNTGEKRACKTPIYRCQSAQSGIPHDKTKQFHADGIETLVFSYLGELINGLLKNDDIGAEIEVSQKREKRLLADEIKKIKKDSDKILCKIEMLQSHIPEAMAGEYPFTVDEIAKVIHKEQAKMVIQKQLLEEKEKLFTKSFMKNVQDSQESRIQSWEIRKAKPPTWKQLFEKADAPTKRILANKLIERIDVTREQVSIRFHISYNPKDFCLVPQNQKNNHSPTTP